MKEENHSEERLLIAKNLSGEASPAEKEALSDWIGASQQNEKIFQELKKAYELSARYKPGAGRSLGIDVDQEWNRFIEKAERGSTGRILEFPSRQGTFPMALRIAAAALIIVASGLVINYFVQADDRVFVTAESTQIVVLPDGSRVFLNRNSKLTYKKSYGKENRDVILSGEAFFEVEGDPQNPFTVQLKDAEITVLGTSFNVRAYDEMQSLEVTVETGVVNLAPKEIAETLELRAGDKGIFERKDQILLAEKNEDANYLAWKTKKITFDGNSLMSAAKTLE
ncbi:MAG: FecR domain-containing protein, partial [Cyclobacteriaceae bacterium]